MEFWSYVAEGTLRSYLTVFVLSLDHGHIDQICAILQLRHPLEFHININFSSTMSNAIKTPALEQRSPNTDDRAPGVIALLIAMTIIPTLAVALRIWSRALIPTSSTSRAWRFWWDDWLVFLDLVSVTYPYQLVILNRYSHSVWPQVRWTCIGLHLDLENIRTSSLRTS